MLELQKAEYVGGFRIYLQFNDGKAGVVDLSESLWGPMFEPLKDIEAFKRFTVSPVLHTVCWENEADFAPEFLYQKMVQQATEPDAARR